MNNAASISSQEKLYQWILRQQQEGSRVATIDIVTHLQVLFCCLCNCFFFLYVVPFVLLFQWRYSFFLFFFYSIQQGLRIFRQLYLCI